MSKIKVIIISVLTTLYAIQSHAMVYDNRYFPLILKPYIVTEGRPSHVAGSLFMCTGSKAMGLNEEDVGIPELNGKFDLRQLSESFVELNIPNPLRSELRTYDIPFTVNGVIQSQGFSFAYQQQITDIFSMGFNWFFMRSYSRQEFAVDLSKNLGQVTDAQEMDDTRRQMFKQIGLVQSHADQFGMGDLDVYARFGYSWPYTFKFRRIDFDGKVGVLIPAGVTHNNNVPASVPFGGDGFWGMYAQIDNEYELREDLTFGFLARAQKRFQQTRCERVPILLTQYQGEPNRSKPVPKIFAPIVTPVRINPGVTLAFSPYIMIENLRKGLGARVQYTLTKHWQDAWHQVNCASGATPLDLRVIQELSGWKSDYMTLSIFYDFGKVKVKRFFEPIVLFSWDIPSLFFSAEKAATTHKISLGIEFNF